MTFQLWQLVFAQLRETHFHNFLCMATTYLLKLIISSCSITNFNIIVEWTLCVILFIALKTVSLRWVLLVPTHYGLLVLVRRSH